MAFDTPATRRNAKLRLFLEGPSGSGKTMTGLLLAALLGAKKIGVGDSERGSASKYAGLTGLPEFFVEELHDASLDDYLKLLGLAEASNVDTLILDSWSHSWLSVLEEVDRLGGNRFTNGWKTMTPKLNAFVNAVLRYPGHIIATARAKTAYELSKDERGKAVPQKVGLAPVAREGTDYEFDIVLTLGLDGTINVTKSRCPGLQGIYTRDQLPTIAKAINAWLSEGSPLSVSEVLAEAIRAATTDAQLAEVGKKIAANKEKLSDAEKLALRDLYAKRKTQIAALANELPPLPEPGSEG